MELHYNQYQLWLNNNIVISRWKARESVPFFCSNLLISLPHQTKDVTNLTSTVSTIDELPGLAERVIKQFNDCRIFIFYGQLGAGKTTFIKQLCAQLGVTDSMSSPTFGLVNQYLDKDDCPIYHLDCYRLEKESEAWDIGLEEILDETNYCFIEWPDKILNLLPENYVRVEITLKEAQRTFNFTTAR